MLARELLFATTAMRFSSVPLQDALHAFKRQLIVEVLAQYDGNRSRAAAALGIERTSLLRLIRELGIRVESRSQRGRPRGRSEATP